MLLSLTFRCPGQGSGRRAQDRSLAFLSHRHRSVRFFRLCLAALWLSLNHAASFAQPNSAFHASGRFGLKLEQADKTIHMQGLFEVRTDDQTAQVELYDPAGQRILLWRQAQFAETVIETAKDGPSSALLVQDWLARRGIAVDMEQLDAWRWRSWLDLEEGRFRQGSLIIERSAKRLVIEQEQGTKLRLVIVPAKHLKR